MYEPENEREYQEKELMVLLFYAEKMTCNFSLPTILTSFGFSF